MHRLTPFTPTHNCTGGMALRRQGRELLRRAARGQQQASSAFLTSNRQVTTAPNATAPSTSPPLPLLRSATSTSPSSSSSSSSSSSWQPTPTTSTATTAAALLLGALLLGQEHENATARQDAKTLPPKGSTHGNGHGLGRYFVANAVEAAAPAVANITVNIKFHAGRWMPTYATQSGSGFVISEDGLVVTNAHVVASSIGGEEPVMITLTDGRRFPAKVHSIDARTDVALLQVETKGQKLPVARIGQSSSLRPGEWVVALGSPQGLANTVTVGIVSAVARLGSELGLLHTRAEYIQTDAAINAGNSGGPLVNLDGEVVGINSMKLEYSDGIGFAIPIDSAYQIIQQLIKYKRVRRPYVGLSFRLVTIEGLETDKAKDTDKKDVGMLVLEVKPGSPAEKAGLQEGDVVIEIDGAKVRGLGDVTEKIGLEPEKTFKVKVIRHGVGKPLMMSVTSVADERGE